MDLFVRGKEVPHPCTEIRLFALLDGMKWAHLPVAGGLYDQSPELLDAFRHIFAERGKEQDRERKKNEREVGQARSKVGKPLGRAR